MNELLAVVAVVIGGGVLALVAGVALRRVYEAGRNSMRQEQLELDRRVELERGLRDHEIRNLPDDELDRRLDRWMREHGVDPRR